MRMIVPGEMDGLTVLQVLTQCAGDVPLWAVRQAIRERQVRLDGERVSGETRVRAGQELRAYFPKAALAAAEREPKPVEVVYEDAQVLLIAKPQGLPAQNEEDPASGDTALTRAIAHVAASEEKTDRVRLCHRLDVQTGGLLLLTKTDEAYAAALDAFTRRTMRKWYVCRVKGCPAQPEGTLRAWLRKDAALARVSVTDYPARGAQEIVTAYRVIEPGEQARLQVELITGRTHQIRAHLAHIGHPVLGDDKYGDRALNRRLGLRRQQLWAWRLEFHAGGALAYLDGRAFEAPCPF